MLKAIKTLFQNTSSTASADTSSNLSNHLSNNALAEYYQARLQTSKSAVEIEAIFSMNTFMSFSEQEDQHCGEVK